MNRQHAQEKLAVLHQSHLLEGWEALEEDQQAHLLSQIEDLDGEIFLEQQRLLQQSSHPILSLTPFQTDMHSGNLQDRQAGERLIEQGQVGCLLVAGGEGTRLNFDGPKGMFPITPIKHKTLFQLFAEKAAAAGKRAKRPLSLAIMTSLHNHQQTVEYFKSHDYFGLSPKHLQFFPQKNLPLLDAEGRLFLESPGKIAEGPDGNGDALRQFTLSGLWKAWVAQGIRFLNFILIDNPLADPFDAELVGCHYRLNSDILIKCTTRLNPLENVGVLAQDKGKIRVVEYSEISESERTAFTPQGTLRYPCANLSLFSLKMDFIEKIAGISLPLHRALKPVKSNKETRAWKFERFIFDILPYTDQTAALLYPREVCFAPLKNSGNIQEVQRALQARDRQVLESIIGHPCGEEPFEISQEFYYPTPQLLAQWKGKKPNKAFFT